jgi:hypothetical protein
VYASAVSSGHDEGGVVKITIMVKHSFYDELDLVKGLSDYRGPKIHHYIYSNIIKANFWPPCQCSELLHVTSSAYLITAYTVEVGYQ